MVKKALPVLVLILVIAASGVWIYHSRSGLSQKYDLDPYQALGAGVAEETAKLLGNKAQIVVIAPDTSQSPSPSIDAQLSSFQQALKKNGLTAASTVRFTLTPQDRMGSGGAVPGHQFLKVVQEHKEAGAVVLFCSFPQMAPQEYDALKQGKSKFVVVSGYLPGYRRLLEAQVLHRAIVPRPGESATPPKSWGSARERFESEFVVITPENVSTSGF